MAFLANFPRYYEVRTFQNRMVALEINNTGVSSLGLFLIVGAANRSTLTNL
jgi:hypothetical protein